MSAKKRAKVYDADALEQKELAGLAQQLAQNDKTEISAWKLETDLAAYGRKKIDIPDRWE